MDFKKLKKLKKMYFPGIITYDFKLEYTWKHFTILQRTAFAVYVVAIHYFHERLFSEVYVPFCRKYIRDIPGNNHKLKVDHNSQLRDHLRISLLNISLLNAKVAII